MHVTLVEINVHEDKIDEFIEVFARTTGSVQEEGNCASMSYRTQK